MDDLHEVEVGENSASGSASTVAAPAAAITSGPVMNRVSPCAMKISGSALSKTITRTSASSRTWATNLRSDGSLVLSEWLSGG